MERKRQLDDVRRQTAQEEARKAAEVAAQEEAYLRTCTPDEREQFLARKAAVAAATERVVQVEETESKNAAKRRHKDKGKGKGPVGREALMAELAQIRAQLALIEQSASAPRPPRQAGEGSVSQREDAAPKGPP